MTQAPDLAPPPTLEVRGGRKNFGAVHALRGVDLVARAGEVTALVGDNGAGKSTMIKCVAGIYAFDAGEVLFEGEQTHISSPADANALGIEVVYQDLALCDNLDIVHNMFLGRELKNGFRLDESAMETRAAEVLASLSVRTVRSIRQDPLPGPAEQSPKAFPASRQSTPVSMTATLTPAPVYPAAAAAG